MNTKRTHQRSAIRRVGVKKATTALVLKCFRELERRKDPVLVSEISGENMVIKNAMRCLIKLGLVEKVVVRGVYGRGKRTGTMDGYLLRKEARKTTDTFK